MRSSDAPPPGPGRASVRQSVELVLRPLELVERYARRYGELFAVQLGDTTRVFVTAPAALREMSVDDGKRFTAEPVETFRPLTGFGSIAEANGAAHLHQRRMLSPAFRGQAMMGRGPLIFSVTDDVIAHRGGGPVAVYPLTQEITLRVMSRLLFGAGAEERSRRIREQFVAVMNHAVGTPLRLMLFRSLRRNLGAASPWGRFLRRRRELDRLLYLEIAERRRRPAVDGDVLSGLMQASDHTGSPLSDHAIRNHLVTLLITGQETTAAALAWAIHWLARSPDVTERIVDELSALGDDAEPRDIVRLPYLSAVCDETLRISSMVPFGMTRTVGAGGCDFAGYSLAPGTQLVSCIYVTHRRPELYPEPGRFDPERFLRGRFSQYEFMPFGAGSRRCLGSSFALFEMKLVLARLCTTARLGPSSRPDPRPVFRGATLTPPSTVRVDVSRH